MLSVGAFVIGTSAIAVVVVVLAYASVQVRRAAVPEWTGPIARLAEAIVALSLLITVAQLMGAVHQLRPMPVLVAELAAGVATAVVARRRTRPADSEPGADRSRPNAIGLPEKLLAAAAIGLVAVQWATHVAYALGRGMTHPDSLWYHQPFAATFVQRGAFTGIDALGYDAARFYPFDSQLVHALGMLAYGRDILSPLLNLAWLALLLLAGWCIGTRRGLGLVSITLMSVVLGLPIMTATQPGQASSDLACAAFLVAAAALLLWGDFRPAPMTLAGLAAGMALGTKISVAAALGALLVAVALLAVRSGHRRAAWLWSGAFVVMGSFWFLRNWIESGNPLPWFGLHIGPVRFDRQIVGATASLAHDVLDPAAWRDLYIDGLWQGLGRGWPVVVVLLFGTVLALMARSRPPLLRLVGFVSLVGIVGYVFTPFTGGFGFAFNLRYLSPIMLLAFAALPLLAPDTTAARRTTLAGCAVMAVAAATMPNREQVPAWPKGELLPGIALTLVVLVSIVVVWRARRVLVGALVIVALIAAMFGVQRHYLERRYVADGLGTQDVDTFFRDVRDSRVVTLGSDAFLPLFGVDLSNIVSRGDIPLSDVAGLGCAGWRERLSGVDYVLLFEHQFGFFIVPPVGTVEDDANAHVVLRGENVTVYRMSGPFDPASCPTGT